MGEKYNVNIEIYTFSNKTQDEIENEILDALLASNIDYTQI